MSTGLQLNMCVGDSYIASGELGDENKTIIKALNLYT